MRVWLLLLLALNLTLAVAQSGSSLDVEQQKREALERAEAERKVAWRDALRELARTEKTAIVFDVRTDVAPPRGITSPIGREGLALIADAYARQYQEIKGVQVFKRNLTASGRPMTFNPAASLANFLAGMPQDLVQRITGDGLPISLVPAEKRWYLSLLLGEYPAMNVGTAAKDYSNTYIQLKAAPTYDYEDPREKGRWQTDRPIQPREVREELTKDEVDRIREGATLLGGGSPYGMPPSGELDFSKGELITLGEVVDRARAQFKIGYLLDRRLSASLVFVMGSFDRETFESVMRDFSRSPGLVPLVMDARSAKEALQAMLAGPLSHLRSQDLSEFTDADLTVGDLENGKLIRLGDLLRGNSVESAYLNGLGITVDKQVKARVSLQLSVSRVSATGTGWKKIRGLPISIVGGS